MRGCFFLRIFPSNKHDPQTESMDIAPLFVPIIALTYQIDFLSLMLPKEGVPCV